MHPLPQSEPNGTTGVEPSISNGSAILANALGQRSHKLTVNAADFGVRTDGSDCTAAVRKALEYCSRIRAHSLTFPKGRYVFQPRLAAEQYLFISNNDKGLRRIAFYLSEFSSFEIDGQGADFVFQGLIVPFVVSRSSEITIKNLTVDWAVPFHCEGRVVSRDAESIELAISEEFPYRVVNGRFQSLGASAEGWRLRHLLEFDPLLGETACGASDYYGVEDKFSVVEIAPGRVRLNGPVAEPLPKEGNVILLSDSRRLCPAFFVTDTVGFVMSDVSIFHAGAMGVIAQRSADIQLKELRVVPPPGNKRVISATADATHFVSCRGRIELTDCTFRTQVDDATNVHGVYTRIASRPTMHSVVVQLVHPQQAGTQPFEAGHRLQFVSRRTLARTHEAVILAVAKLNDEYTILHFSDTLPADIREHDAVLDLFWQPSETIIRRCTVHGNRARGFLLSVTGRILVEGCRFHTPGAAILLEGDANDWFEAGPVDDLTIRNNDFVCCNYGPWGKAAIQISPGIQDSCHHEPRYHHNVRIEHNQFEVFFPTLLDARDTNNLVFVGNQVIRSTAYPQKGGEAPPFIIEDCSSVQIMP